VETTPHPVQHATAAQRFELHAEGVTALAEYLRENGRVIFTHTFVPPEMRGKGLAESLVRAALAWARAEKLKVVPQCSYVARFIERHAEYRDLL
jgi:hypothetical protein